MLAGKSFPKWTVLLAVSVIGILVGTGYAVMYPGSRKTSAPPAVGTESRTAAPSPQNKTSPKPKAPTTPSPSSQAPSDKTLVVTLPSPKVSATIPSQSGGVSAPLPKPPTPTPPLSSNPCATFPALPAVKPTAANTGVPAGTFLTNAPGYNVTGAGTVIDGKNITDGIAVKANNVTIKNSRVSTTGFFAIKVADGITGTKILNSEIYTDNGGYIGVYASNTIVCGSLFRGYENALTIGGGMIVQANYIDRLYGIQAAPHFDGIEVYDGGNSKIWGNLPRSHRQCRNKRQLAWRW